MKGSKDKRRKPVFSLGRRMGRKGDPRMHLAVSARLADPNISLFHALRAGGFNYPDDIDAKAVDEENVTLAQRKNQLSRRLRMAKSVEVEVPKKGPPTSQQTMSDLVEAQQASFQNLLRQNTGGSSVASVDSYDFPDNHSLSHECHKESDTNPAPFAHATEQKMEPVAGFPPAATNPDHVNHHLHHLKEDSKGFPNHILGPPAPPPTLEDRMSSRSVSHSETGTTLCSEFGLRSLHRTAQSVGLSLDQLALVLSSTENLAEKLGITQNNQERV